MHNHTNPKMFINRFRSVFARLCLVMLVISLILAPGMPLQDARAQSTFDCGSVTEIPQAECEALVDFYQSTSAWGWAIDTNWLDTNTPCSWYGVYCGSGTIIGLGPMTWCARQFCEQSMDITGAIPPTIGNLINLNWLNLWNNHIFSLPAEIGNLFHLNSLILAVNELTNLPAEIGNLANLEILDLEFNGLSSLPAEIGGLTNLENLNLRYNGLTSLPNSIGDLVHLSNIALDHNLLSSLPAGIGNLTNISDLDLSFNHLTSLPAEIGNLTGLKSFSPSYNEITSLPVEIGNLTNLTVLNLAGNLLTSLPLEIFNLYRLETLDLGANRFTTLPTQIRNLTNLTNLGISYNQLTGLPPEIGNLTSLTGLFLSSNQLTNLPPEIGILSNLRYLNLIDNQFSSLPLEIGNLSNLLYLHLSDNQLSSLPPEFGNLQNLIELYLTNNLLTSLPPEFGNLSNLMWLDLSFNQLSSLPPEFGNLGHLYGIDLSFNRLSISDLGLLNFLNQWDPDWADTQTVPPTDLHLRSAAPGSLEFAWTPIRYSAGDGFYELSYATHPNGPFTVHGITPEKNSGDYLADSLPASSEYYARLRTFSAAIGEQLQDLWSEYSPTIAVLTTPITPVPGASLEYTDEMGRVTKVEVPPGAVSADGTLYFSTHAGLELPIYLSLAGQAFSLGMYQDGAFHDDLPLLAPMTLTLEYNENVLSGENLMLMIWDAAASNWLPATETCSPTGTLDHDPVQNRLVVTACQLGTYALVEVWSVSHLPVVNRDASLP